MSFFSKTSSELSGTFIPYTPSGVSSNGTSTLTTVSQTSGVSAAVNIGSFAPLGNLYGRGRTTFSVNNLPPGLSFSNSGVLSGSTVVGALNSPSVTYQFSITATETVPGSPISTSTTREFQLTVLTPWKYRQIITTGYMAGGYKDSSLWSNVNRVEHATDTSTNLGDGTIDNFHYKSGATGLSKLYVWNGSTTAFNMRTEVKQNSGPTPGAGNNGTVYNEVSFAYANGEGVGEFKKWRFSDETFISNLGSGWTDHAAAISGEYRGIMWGNSGQTQRIIYSTDSIAGMGYSAGAHGQQKGMMAKTGFGYGGAQGTYNGGYTFRKTNIESESSAGGYNKPRSNCGEENFGMGQDHSYMIGNYDGGGQNNGSFKYTHATDSGFNGGAAMEPKGHGGCSSGHMGWRD